MTGLKVAAAVAISLTATAIMGAATYGGLLLTGTAP